MTTEPKRLVDDSALSEALRADLSLAARVDPIAYDVSAGLARLENAVHLTGAGGAAGSGASASSSGLGLGLGLVLMGGVIAALVWRSPSPDAVPEAVADERVSAIVTPASPEPEVRPPAPSVVRPVASSAAFPATAAARPAELADVPEEEPEALEPEALEPEAIEPKSLEPEEDPRSRRARSRDAAREVTSARVETPPESKASAQNSGEPDDRYLREVRQLNRARGELAKDPAAAHELAQTGLREFPDGALRQEWEGVAVLALFGLGREEEARRRGAAFLRDYPVGPFSARIRTELER